MTKFATSLLTIALLALTINCHAAAIDGYEGVKWGTIFHKVVDAYPKGKMSEYNKQMVYTQDKPDDTIASRMFVFDKHGQLVSVAVTFDSNYVTKTGTEALKRKFIKEFGKGKASKQGSHMSSYVWDVKQTKVSYLYVPNHPEMTVLQFEKK